MAAPNKTAPQIALGAVRYYVFQPHPKIHIVTCQALSGRLPQCLSIGCGLADKMAH